MKVTALIVNFYTARFLPPLLEVLNCDPLVKSIIVADNSQEIGLPELLKKFSKTRLIVFSQNIGFAAAINQAAKSVDSEWWLVINPDTLPDKDCVEKLLAGAEKTNALIAGPRFYWDDEKIFRLPPALGYSWWIQAGMVAASSFDLDAKVISFYWNMRFKRFWSEPEPFFEPFLSGACLLIRNDKHFFRDGTIFDERFFLYYEETDLCIRSMTENQRIVCIPDACCIHFWDQSPRSEKSAMMADSTLKFMKKHYPLNVTNNEGHFHSPIGLINMGKLFETPQFNFETKIPEEQMILEFGVNHFFVPNIQTILFSNRFSFPDSIWNRLAPGTYFTCIRDSFNKIHNLWKWIK